MSSPSRCSQDHHWAEHRRGHLLVIRRLSSGHPFNHRPSGHLYQRYASPPPQRCPRLPRLNRWQSLLVRLRPKSVFWCSRPRKADGNHLFTPVTQTGVQQRCAPTCKLHIHFRDAFFTQRSCSASRSWNDLVLAAENGAAARTLTPGCSLWTAVRRARGGAIFEVNGLDLRSARSRGDNYTTFPAACLSRTMGCLWRRSSSQICLRLQLNWDGLALGRPFNARINCVCVRLQAQKDDQCRLLLTFVYWLNQHWLVFVSLFAPADLIGLWQKQQKKHSSVFFLCIIWPVQWRLMVASVPPPSGGLRDWWEWWLAAVLCSGLKSSQWFHNARARCCARPNSQWSEASVTTITWTFRPSTPALVCGTACSSSWEGSSMSACSWSSSKGISFFFF